MKLSRDLIGKISELLEKGYYVKDITDYLEINESTYYYWQNQAKELGKQIEAEEIKKKDLTEYQLLLMEFFKSVKKAASKAIMKNVDIIQKAAKDQWQAAAWYLERRDYKNWGRKEKHEIQGNLDNKIEYIIHFEGEDNEEENND